MKYFRINNVHTNLALTFEKEESILLYEFELHSFPLNRIYHVTSGRPEE